MQTIDLDDFDYKLKRYCSRPTIDQEHNDFVEWVSNLTWKPIIGFQVKQNGYYYYSWLEENNIEYIYLHGNIVFKDENDALLFKLHWSK